MTKRSNTTRTKMAEAFRQAAAHIWDGKGSYDSCSGYRYACFALLATAGSVATRYACEREIELRLGGCSSVEEWLQVHKYTPEFDFTGYRHRALRTKVQAYRKAWLLHLAEEFSNPSKRG